MTFASGGSALGSTVPSAVGLDLTVSPMCLDLGVGGPMSAASTSVRLVDGVLPLPSSSEASSGLLELGAIWKSARAGQHDQFALPELALSPGLVGFGPAFLDVLGDCP
jgi:hypothetical protein